MKKRILIVDDMPVVITPLMNFFNRNGYDVVAATNAVEALQLAAEKKPDVAIIDLCLLKVNDDNDFSGLDLARKLDPQLPKIILTAHPSVKAVREALGRTTEGIPLAVAFVAKKEPMEALLQAVQLALTPPNPEILQCFEAPAMHALPEQLEVLGLETSASRLGQLITSQRRDVSRQVELQMYEAEQHHHLSVAVSILALVLMLATIVLIFCNRLSLSVAAGISSLLTHFISVVFSKQSDRAHQRVESSLREAKDLVLLASLLEFAKSFHDPAKQDYYCQIVFESFLDRLGRPKRRAKGAGGEE